MGANQSSLIQTGEAAYSVSAKLASRHAFQILRVHPNSPVSEANVFPYFDYIIAINGVEVVTCVHLSEFTGSYFSSCFLCSHRIFLI